LTQESKIEDNSDQVALCAIVLVVIVTIDNVILSVIEISSKVLEKLNVDWISENIVSVNSLKMKLVVTHPGLLDALLGLVHHGLDTKLVRILLLLESPILVVIIKAVLIEVDFFIDLEFLDHHALAA
jgi:hypothetical protein